MSAGTRIPCQWIIVASGRLFVSFTSIVAPTLASITGPGTWPLKVNPRMLRPGANSQSASRASSSINREVVSIGRVYGQSLRKLGVRPMDPASRSTDFVALGQPGSDHYAGLETFANPGVSRVEMTSDELTAVCPVTRQPDLYVATIEFWPLALCIESKSLKLYLNGFRNEEHFCEALAVKIRDDVAG